MSPGTIRVPRMLQESRAIAISGLTVAAVVAASVSACSPDRGQCLETRTVHYYRPTEIFLGGRGYAHDYVPTEYQQCVRWEHPAK